MSSVPMPRGPDRSRVVALLNGGDWSCAHAQEESLAVVASELASAVPGKLAKEMRTIADLARRDFVEANRRWESASDRLREDLRL
jgi:hypothetical protein